MGRPVWFKIDDITDKPRGLLLPGKIAQSIKLAISPFVSAVTAALEIAGTVEYKKQHYPKNQDNEYTVR